MSQNFIQMLSNCVCIETEFGTTIAKNDNNGNIFKLEQTPIRTSEYKNGLKLNDYPVIGVLAQEISYVLNKLYPNQYKSFIAASYVKYVEGGGARVVPIFIGRNKDYYRDIMSKINGVLFPGGSTWFNVSNGYADAGRYIYEIAKEMNDQGNYFPLWGTCLGFELLTFADANGVEHRDTCDSHNLSLPLEFTSDFMKSKLFKNAPQEVIDDLEKKPVTYNFHQFCLTHAAFQRVGISENWRVMSMNQDHNGVKFISTIEHKKYPFYGVQFHPEKNPYEWIRNKGIFHTKETIRVSQYFAQFFVNEARLNQNTFMGKIKEESKYVIYNFPITFTGQKGSVYEQCYLFDEHVDYKLNNTATVSKSMIMILICIHGIWKFCSLHS